MTLLEMSLAGAVLVAVVAAVRAFILHRLPKGTLLALWGLALARFLLPVSLPSPVSAYTLGASAVVSQSVMVAQAGPFPQVVPEALPADVQEDAALPVELAALLPLAWAAGSAGCALYFAAVSAHCRREFRMSLPAGNQPVNDWLAAHPLRRPVAVRVSDRISAPLTYGILRPVILLPDGFDCSGAGQLDYVLTHEWVHICHLDGLFKLLAAAAACLHWWNPAVWVLYVLFNRDLELACDEAVVRRCGGRGDYARALIRLAEWKSGLAPFCSGFNHNAMEERILAIMKMKKLTRRTAAASAATVLAVAALFATSSAVEPAPAETADAPIGQLGYWYPWYPADQVDWDGERELLEGFEAFGISYDREGKMYFHGERVRWFWDGYEIWEDGSLLGWSMRYEYLDQDGTVDVRTIHAAVDNGDGSLDYYGPLSDIVAYSQEEFDSRTYESIRRNSMECVAVSDSTVLVEDALHPGSGSTYVEAYAEEGGTDTMTSYDVVDESTQQQATGVYTDCADMVEAVSEGAAAYAMDSGNAPAGRTFEEIFAGYRAYGITYRERDGIREVFYNGELAAHFADIKPDGSAFTFSSNSGTLSTLSVQTVYDGSGRLAGVQPAGESASFAAYARYGLTANGSGKLEFGGRLVRCFDDSVPKPDGGTKAVGYYNEAGIIDVRAVRDARQELTGLEVAAEEEYRSRAIRVPGKAAAGTGSNLSAFEPYTAFGLRIDGGALYYNGARVRYFCDQRKGVFGIRREVTNWDSQGTVDVYAVRDQNLTGLRLASAEEFAANTAANTTAAGAASELAG